MHAVMRSILSRVMYSRNDCQSLSVTCSQDSVMDA